MGGETRPPPKLVQPSRSRSPEYDLPRRLLAKLSSGSSSSAGASTSAGVSGSAAASGSAIAGPIQNRLATQAAARTLKMLVCMGPFPRPVSFTRSEVYAQSRQILSINPPANVFPPLLPLINRSPVPVSYTHLRAHETRH